VSAVVAVDEDTILARLLADGMAEGDTLRSFMEEVRRQELEAEQRSLPDGNQRVNRPCPLRS